MPASLPHELTSDNFRAEHYWARIGIDPVIQYPTPGFPAFAGMTDRDAPSVSAFTLSASRSGELAMTFSASPRLRFSDSIFSLLVFSLFSSLNQLFLLFLSAAFFPRLLQ